MGFSAAAVTLGQQDDWARWVDAGEGREILGDFKGGVGSGLVGRLRDLVFEQENDGQLYRDLGDLTLGLSVDLGEEGSVSWDNSFFRRVIPYHDEIVPGGQIEPGDLSRYMDVKTIVSRGRADYNFLASTDGAFAGVRIEGGTSLTLAHAHPALPLGERPLTDVLEEDGPESISKLLRQDLRESGRRPGDPSLLALGAKGIAALVRLVSDAVNRRTAVTERSAIFWEGYADPITQIVDLGIPVDAEIFLPGGVLDVGDRVRHVTFLGLSPLGAGYNQIGLSFSYQRYVRLVRETTIVKEADQQVTVVVRNALSSGNELIPLKVRPEVRILGVLKLGYTFFEQIYDRAGTTSWEAAYRVDLTDPRAVAAFRQLLQEGKKVHFKPLASVAQRGDGAELLHEETRRGKRRSAIQRARLFAAVQKRGSRNASTEHIVTDKVSLQQLSRVRASRFRKRWGRDRDSARIFSVTAQGDLDFPGEPADYEWEGAITLVSGFRDSYADQLRLERVARTLAVLDPGLDLEALVEELGELDEGEESRLLVNSLLSLSGDHIDHLITVEEDHVWSELSYLLLGEEHASAWSTAEQRRQWRRHTKRMVRSLGGELAPVPASVERKKPLGARRRYRIARGVARRFEHFQETIRSDGDCLGCLARAFDEFRNVVAMQALLRRLAVDDSLAEPGYHYEVYADSMLRPATLTNGVRYSFPVDVEVLSDLVRYKSSGEVADEGETDAMETLLREAHQRRNDWIGVESLYQASRARLSGGLLLANVGAVAQAGGCFTLRLFSDYAFHPDLRLRLDLRLPGEKVDGRRPTLTAFFPLGDPTVVEAAPFSVARNYFDVRVPGSETLEEGRAYNVLLRVINREGLPVTGEQKLRFSVPAGLRDRLTPGCEAAGPEDLETRV
jgi:hypothetical protein